MRIFVFAAACFASVSIIAPGLAASAENAPEADRAPNGSSSAASSPRERSGERDASRREGGFYLSSAEHRMVVAINEYREQHGLPPLRVDPRLMRVARQSAPYFNHVVNGQWCWHRARAAGFRGWASDNIANGYPTPEDAVQGWATSDGHARQMRGYFKMNGRWCDYCFNCVGVGVSGRKYIAVFGRDDSRRSSSDERRSSVRSASDARRLSSRS